MTYKTKTNLIKVTKGIADFTVGVAIGFPTGAFINKMPTRGTKIVAAAIGSLADMIALVPIAYGINHAVDGVVDELGLLEEEES